MKNYNNIFNGIGIVVVIIVIIFTVVARDGLTELYSITEIFLLFSLTVTLLCLPDYLLKLFKKHTADRWYVAPEFFTFCTLIFFGVSGLLFENIIALLKFVLLPVSLMFLVRTFNLIYKNKLSILLFVGITLPIIMLLLFFNKGYESPVFFEKILLGEAHIDVLFFSSISNIISNVGYSSTGLDGIPYFPYHWGAYALFGGLKSWIGINSLAFINLAYPAIFIVLYLKIFASFLYRFFLFKGKRGINILFVFTVLVFFYSLPYTGLNKGNPVNAGNNGLAFIFSFQYLAVFLNYLEIQKKKKVYIHFSFLIYSFFILLLVLLFKISVGFAFSFALFYICYRYREYFGIWHNIFVIISAFILAVFTYLVVFPKARTTIDSSFIERFYFLWAFSDSFITYLLGAFIAIVVFLKRSSIYNVSGFINVYHSRNYIDYEILFLVTLFGMLGGLFVTSNPSDVSYFASTQFYFSIPFVIYYLHNEFDKFKASVKFQNAFLILIIFFSFFSRPDLLKYKDGLLQFIEINKKAQKLSDDQRVLKELLLDLQQLDKEQGKRDKCIYIAQKEDWFYNSQKEYPKSAPMIVPAITGISMIGGIADSVMNTDYNYYSYYYYKKGYRSINNIDDAMKSARDKGFKTLIKYEKISGKLNKKIYSLINTIDEK